MKYKCVIFDCDGVLVDTESISVRVLMELSQYLGLELEFENAVEVFTGLSLVKCFEYIDKRVEVDLPDDIEP
jgi:beta-phosphoglucomutase-like phosphatase (HAD superfamily)